ncbi:MAG: TonB-dependent receptor [Chitinophagaceae bacterium]
MRSFLTVTKKKPLPPGKLLITKLVTLFFIFLTLNASATGSGDQTINLSVEKTEISGVLRSIEKQTTYRFLYNDQLEDMRDKVSVIVVNAKLTDVLNLVLHNTRLSYQEMENNLIVIKEKMKAPAITITGTITDGTLPLSGVSVVVKGTSIGTTTAADGTFSINVPDSSAVLVISSVGYEGKEVKVGSQTNITISLTSSATTMDQVVVVGYGTSSRRDLTAPVGIVNTEELNKRTTANPMQALQGAAAGVQVVTNNAPGSTPTVRIRGVGSFNNNNPLFVVDGMFFENIDFLNSSDIGEMSVLKDASAAAIYGVRAANGVVIITTKRGKYNQKTRVTYTGYVGLQVRSGDFKLANGAEYSAMQLAKGTAADSFRVTSSVAKFGGSGVNATTNTDWYDEILKKSALMHSHSVDLSGGTEKVNYNFGLNYLFQDGIVDAENDYKRYNIRFQVEAKPYDWLKVGISTLASNFTQRNPNISAFGLAYNASPLYPVFDETNALTFPLKFTSSSTLGFNNGVFNNPAATAKYWFDKTKAFLIVPTLYAEAEVIKNKLSFRSQLSQRYGSDLNQNYIPAHFVDNNQQLRLSVLTTTETRTENYILDNLITYKGKIKQHRWSLLGGQSVREERFRSSQMITDSVSAQQEFWYSDQGSRRPTGYNETGFRNASVSFFGRLSYDYDGKYLLTATFRADGSSKFQEKWGYFPSVGLGWVISDEKFMSDQNVFSFLKLRGSWGKLGNDNIRPSPGYAVVSTGNDFGGVYGSTATTNGQTQTGFQVQPITGSVIWEVVNEWDGGIDFTMLKERLKGSVDYYNRVTEDLAFERPLPGINITQYGNFGNVRNSGIEIVLNWADKIGDLNYSFGGNLSTLKNRLTSLGVGGLKNLPGGIPEFPTQSMVGEPFNYFLGFEVIGIYQNAAEVAADPIGVANNALPGFFRYKDQNGDRVLDANDRINLGNYLPKVTYGFNLNLDYKKFDLGIVFQGVGGNKILNYNRTQRQKFPDVNGDRKFVTGLWTGEGSTNKFPSAFATTQAFNNTASSFYVESGSYLRLQNVQLGYNFKVGKGDSGPEMRVYVTADRPKIWTKYSGVTPEIAPPSQLAKDRSAGPTNTPPAFTSGIGYDSNVYPTTAVYSFGVRITY